MGEIIVVGSSANGYDWIAILVLYAIFGTLLAIVIAYLAGSSLAIVDPAKEEEKSPTQRRSNDAMAGFIDLAKKGERSIPIQSEQPESNKRESNGNNAARETLFLSIALLLLAGYVMGYFAFIGPWFGDSIREQDQRFHQQALEKAIAMQDEYRNTRLYLRENVTDPGTWGEIKGSISGFLSISGNIYGKIEAGRVLSVVYLQPEQAPIGNNYAGKHLVFSKPLDEVVIETIPVGDKPYLQFSEAFHWRNANMKRYEVHPWKPHLYLPEGWKIL